MIAIIFGALFILTGVMMAAMAILDAGVAQRPTTTRWENVWPPLLWFSIPTAIGVALILSRAA